MMMIKIVIIRIITIDLPVIGHQCTHVKCLVDTVQISSGISLI